MQRAITSLCARTPARLGAGPEIMGGSTSVPESRLLTGMNDIRNGCKMRIVVEHARSFAEVEQDIFVPNFGTYQKRA